jgi:N-methylhydantoinase A
VFSGILMRELGSRSAYVPADSGVFSAFGMLTTDIAFQEERSTTLRSPLTAENAQAINTLYKELTERVLGRFTMTGLDTKTVRLQRAIDMRFGMQVHELDVDVPLKTLTLADMEQLTKDFIAKYEATYGAESAYIAAGIEFVTFRVTGTLDMERPSLIAVVADGTKADSQIGSKQTFFAPDGFVDTAFHRGDRLYPGQKLRGPAIIQRSGDTVVLPPRMKAAVDDHGGLTITHEAQS